MAGWLPAMAAAHAAVVVYTWAWCGARRPQRVSSNRTHERRHHHACTHTRTRRSCAMRIERIHLRRNEKPCTHTKLNNNTNISGNHSNYNKNSTVRPCPCPVCVCVRKHVCAVRVAAHMFRVCAHQNDFYCLSWPGSERPNVYVYDCTLALERFEWIERIRRSASRLSADSSKICADPK